MKLCGKCRLLRNVAFIVLVQSALIGYTYSESNAATMIFDESPTREQDINIDFMPRLSLNASLGKSFIGNHLQAGIGASGFRETTESINLKYSLGQHGKKITLSYGLFSGAVHVGPFGPELGISYINQEAGQPSLFNGKLEGVALEAGFIFLGFKIQSIIAQEAISIEFGLGL